MSDINELLSDIKAVARTVAFKWPTVTTADDIMNSLTIRLMETPASIDKLLGMSVDKRRSNLARIGHQIASAERDDYEVFSGKYLYSVDDVKRLLSSGVIDGPEDKFRVTGMDVLEAMIELEKKSPQYNKDIISRYVDNVIPKRQSKEQVSLVRAIESLTVLMNRAGLGKKYEFTNGGRHRNNREAVNQGDLDYDGQPRFDG